jgi:hypothetical protein
LWSYPPPVADIPSAPAPDYYNWPYRSKPDEKQQQREEAWKKPKVSESYTTTTIGRPDAALFQPKVSTFVATVCTTTPPGGELDHRTEGPSGSKREGKQRREHAKKQTSSDIIRSSLNEARHNMHGIVTKGVVGSGTRPAQLADCLQRLQMSHEHARNKLGAGGAHQQQDATRAEALEEMENRLRAHTQVRSARLYYHIETRLLTRPLSTFS